METEQRADRLIHALRTMRKHGFSVIEDVIGGGQSEANRFERAKVVAGDLLALEGQPGIDRAVERVAEVLMRTADGTRALPQFQFAENYPQNPVHNVRDI